MARLILVTCGAGINTSTIAEDTIKAKLHAEGINDVEVKRILDADLTGYLDRTDLLLIVSMMKIYRTDITVPILKGMPFLIGTKEEKDVLLGQILEIVRAT